MDLLSDQFEEHHLPLCLEVLLLLSRSLASTSFSKIFFLCL